MDTGPLFALCWLLFTGAYAARFLAALIPLVITVQFFLVGTGIIRDEAASRPWPAAVTGVRSYADQIILSSHKGKKCS